MSELLTAVKSQENTIKHQNGGQPEPNQCENDQPGCISGEVTTTKCGRMVKLCSDYSIFYIGGESLTLTNLMFNFTKCQFYSYNPVTKLGRKESMNINKSLMKRYYMVEKAKDAKIVGVLVGTLGVSNYLEMFNRLKVLLKKAGKKVYSFIVGKINVAKLANFMEIDIFVLIACPENTLLDSSEFYKPVVTPYEMELACNSQREWTGDYVTDFSQLLEGKEINRSIKEYDCMCYSGFTFIQQFLAHLSRRLRGELIVYRSSWRPCVRPLVRASVSPSVHTFNHEYLCNQLADRNEISSEASFGWGKGFSWF